MRNWVLVAVAVAASVVAGARGRELMVEGYAAKARIASERQRAAANSGLVVRDLLGIDAGGNLLEMKRNAPTVLFLLHQSTIATDLHFWREVSGLTPPNRAALVAFCDGDACDASARKLSLPFPVVAYCEMEACQAVLNADARGRALVLPPLGYSHDGPEWRLPGVSPKDVPGGIE